MKQWLISVGALLSAIAFVFILGKRRGKQDMEATHNEQHLKQIKEVQTRIHDAGNLNADDMRDSLRKGEF